MPSCSITRLFPVSVRQDQLTHRSSRIFTALQTHRSRGPLTLDLFRYFTNGDFSPGLLRTKLSSHRNFGSLFRNPNPHRISGSLWKSAQINLVPSILVHPWLALPKYSPPGKGNQKSEMQFGSLVGLAPKTKAVKHKNIGETPWSVEPLKSPRGNIAGRN